MNVLTDKVESDNSLECTGRSNTGLHNRLFIDYLELSCMINCLDTVLIVCMQLLRCVFTVMRGSLQLQPRVYGMRAVVTRCYYY